MTAKEAMDIALKAQKTFEYEYNSVMRSIESYAKDGCEYMPAPVCMSNQLRQRLIDEGYTITDRTLYWRKTSMTIMD